MTEVNKSTPQAKFTPQNVLNNSYDADFDVTVVELLGYDPVNDLLRRVRLDESGNLFMTERPYSVRIAYSGVNPVYIGEAVPGSLTSEAKWKIKKLTYSGDNVSSILWADGNNKYDNIWDNRAILDYS